jgi:hypothetical protein
MAPATSTLQRHQHARSKAHTPLWQQGHPASSKTQTCNATPRILEVRTPNRVAIWGKIALRTAIGIIAFWICKILHGTWAKFVRIPKVESFFSQHDQLEYS